MFLNTNIKSECCGCTACEQVCHLKAISMEADSEGFLYPVKDETLCNKCGLCERICPFEHPSYVNRNSPRVFAAYNKNEAERKKSSSGGGFYIIAKEVIALGGIVYGATMGDDLRVVHKTASTIEELKTLRGSKYVQSCLQDCYGKIKGDLKSSCLVYFTGTPCQVAGLKSYLRKDYPNLLTSDLVCHGVPSQKLFNMHIEYLKEKYSSSKISEYQFRDNERWGGCEIFNSIDLRGVETVRKLPTFELSPFLYSFMYSFTYRYSCYACPFAKMPRQGDITLADYWGVQKYHPEMKTKNGVSLILLNTVHGEYFWNKIKDKLTYVESRLDWAIENNRNLIRTSTMPPVRKGIYELIEKDGYTSVANGVFRSPRYRLIKIKLLLMKLIGADNLQRLKSYWHKIIK